MTFPSLPLPKAADGTTPEMPLLGFGTWQIRGDSAYRAVRDALEAGYRHLDTATMYGNEAEVGRALKDSGVPRDEVFVTTKLPPERAGKERATLDASLKALGVDALDLWLIHWPPNRGKSVKVWREFLAARDAGLIRAAGVSNFGIDEIDELFAATGERPAVNQIRFGPTLWDPAEVGAHRERRRGLFAVQDHQPARPGADRHRHRTRRRPGPGGAALAHPARDRGHPEVTDPGAHRAQRRRRRLRPDRRRDGGDRRAVAKAALITSRFRADSPILAAPCR
jgi:hypothetical protein